jgi:putative transposase
VKSNVSVAGATMNEVVLPERVQEALGQLVGAAKEGLLALSVGVGLGVLSELMEEEVDDVVGPKGKHDSDRTAVRHGHEAGEVTLGGRRVAVDRPRARTVDGSEEIALQTYEHFADRDPLARVVLERMLAGVSTRRYERTQEPVGSAVETEERSTSKSSVSRTFVERTRHALSGEGSSENATVATALLSDLVERGLDPEQGMLLVIDGAKALRKAIRTVFGEVPVQRCIRHKERNVLGHLPERDRPAVKARLRRAWAQKDHAAARQQLELLASELDRTHPGAAGSLREGMQETLTLIGLGIGGALKRTLESTNPCESMIEIVRRTQRNVKHWQNGEMGLRWTAAGMLEAERQFRRIIGYQDLAKLAIAIERDLTAQHQSLHTATEEDTRIPVTV